MARGRYVPAKHARGALARTGLPNIRGTRPILAVITLDQ
jgi:hypothetical protein